MIEPGKHKMTEAMEGHRSASVDARDQPHGPPEPSGHGSTPREAAEEVRREQESEHSGKTDLDRDNQLVRTGRAHQTHG